MQQKNDMRTYLKFVILLVLFASCGFFQPQWVYLSNGGKQAVSSAYHLSKENFVCSPLIDTNIVYIWESELVTVNRYGEKIEGPSTKYQLMCFNSNGICFLTPLTKIYLTDIEVKQYIELNWGQYCYYKVDGSKIVVEVYNYHTKIFEYMYGNILENGDIHFYKTKGRPWTTYTRKENDLYKKSDRKRLAPLIFPQ